MAVLPEIRALACAQCGLTATANAQRYSLGRDALENGDGSMLGISGGLNRSRSFFWATRSGMQGRDIPH